jgi:SAM-dependent methyltransferase
MDNVTEEAVENLYRLGNAMVADNEDVLSEFCKGRKAGKSGGTGDGARTLDETSKYLRLGTADIVKDELKQSGLVVEHVKIRPGFTVNDLVRLCSTIYHASMSLEQIQERVFHARAHAFTIKYAEPTEDEKLIPPEKIKVPGLLHWTKYLFAILEENSVSLEKLEAVDVGAGHGQANKELYKPLHHLRLVDVSATALATAKRSMPWADTIEASAEDLGPIATDSVDAYFSFRTYQSTLFDVRAALHEAYRVLRRKGIFVISIPIMFPKEDGTIAKGLLRPGEKEPDMAYARGVACGIAETATCLQFNNVGVDERSPFELIILGER